LRHSSCLIIKGITIGCDSILIKKKNNKEKNRKNPFIATVMEGFFAAPRWLQVVVSIGVVMAALCLYGIIWHVRVGLGPELLTRVILAMGLLIGLLLVFLVHFAQAARLRAEGVESISQKLQNEFIEHKRAEKELAEFKHKFRLITESMREIIFVYDMNRKLQYVNPASEILTGYTTKELYKQDFIKYIHPDDRARISHLWEKLFRGKGFSEEFRIVAKDGQIKWYLSYWNPVLNKERKQAGVLGTGFDITEHKRTERTLRESEMKFRSVVESANDAIILADSSEKIISWNKGAQTIFGYKQEEVLGKPLALLISRRYGDSYRGLEQFRLTGEYKIVGKTAEFYGLRKDGSEFLLELSLGTWELGKGITFYSIIIRDITERKRTDEKLYEINAALENTVEGISFLDMQGRYVSVNKAYASMVGCNVNEMTGMEWQKTMHPDDLGMGLNAYDEMLKNGKAKFEARSFRKDGSTFYKEVTIIKNIDKNGQFKGHYRFMRDITERKQAEERQARLLKELEGTNQELNDFAYIVSHDLKAPLRAIGSLANWISNDCADKFDEDGKEQMNLLISRVKRMHNLIDGILQYSRAGRIREEKVEVNLNELMPEVIDMIAPPKNIEIKIENELPTILCEKTRIQQVFQNLLSNSVKYMDKPKGEIKIGCIEDNGFWKLNVADNGPGIEEKYFAKIFQIFQTLSPRDEFESTGVGLSVVKKIIEMYDGKIWVESKVGYGSTFFFTLPKGEARKLIFKNIGGAQN
jgi:PAS domain S-box-containing protein